VITDCATLLRCFFDYYSKWNWDTQIVSLAPVVPDHPLAFLPPLTYDISRPQPMVILTPTYPNMNSSFNINEHTRQRIIQEINRGKSIIDTLCMHDRSISEFVVMDTLCEAVPFFNTYKHFLQFTISASTFSEFVKWSGWC